MNELNENIEFMNMLSERICKLFSTKYHSHVYIKHIIKNTYVMNGFSVISYLNNIVFYDSNTPITYENKSLTHQQMYSIIKSEEKILLRQIKIKRLLKKIKV